MKIYATIDNRNYFDQFIGTDIWVECENPSRTHGLCKYQYYKFSQPHPVSLDNQCSTLGVYSVSSIYSARLTYNALSSRYNRYDILNQIQGKYPYELSIDQINSLITTGNILTTDEIYEMLKEHEDEDIR